MTKSLSKVNAASLKVLYTLQLLFERDLSMNDLIKYYDLYHNEFHSNFVMSKYINTCRYCGIDIKKVNNKYTIVNFPICGVFTSGEISLFQELKNCCEKMRLQNLSEKMGELVAKIVKRAERPINPVTTSVIKDSKIKNFEKACLLSQKVKIFFNDKTSYSCDPIDISIKEDRLSLIIFDGKNSKELSPDNIEQIKILPQKTKNVFLPMTAVYELKGKLAKKYQIREHEQILKIHSNGDLVISNKLEDKTKLLHRLMRYGENCEVVSPKSLVSDMKSLIDETLKNYS